jgi:hypothetical protein
MATVQDVVNYYVAKLASIYRNKPKAAATVALFTKQMLADMLADQLNFAFDLDQAFGSQLDTIGKYVGVSRDVGTPDFKPYFGFVTGDYPAGDQNLNGFTSATSLTLNASVVWLRAGMLAQSISQLTDFSYRQLIKIKITTNSSNNTMSEIQDQIQTSFPGQLQLRDNQDMTMSYFYGQSFQLPVLVLQANLPRPMGVGITVSPAIAFDVAIDDVPSYTSETPDPFVDFGSVPVSDAKTFTLTNATATSITIEAIDVSGPIFSVSGISPSLPVTLAAGQSANFVISATSLIPGDFFDSLVITISSVIGTAVYHTLLQIEVGTPVSITWMSYDDFSAYPDGPLPSPNSSLGWAASGSTSYWYNFAEAPRDNFKSYSDGPLPSPNAGFDWAGAGSTVHYSN